MLTKDSIQSTFLEEIKRRLPPNISFADELAELLNISRDSVYRRMRGETILSLDEVKKVCTHYGISLDSLLSNSSQMVSFQLRAWDEEEFTFEKYLKSILVNLEMIGGFPDKHMIYHAKDLPIFHFFRYPELAKFKIFFWLSTFNKNSKLGVDKYRPEEIPYSLVAIGENIWERYSRIYSTEIIGYEILNATLRQIEFAYASGLIDLPTGRALCDDCALLLNNLRIQAEHGSKTSLERNGPDGKFDLYINEVLIGDNTVLFKMGDKRVTFITHNNFNILTTSQESFCKLTEGHLVNIMNKSTLISSSSAKERNRFFNSLVDRVQQVKDKL